MAIDINNVSNANSLKKQGVNNNKETVNVQKQAPETKGLANESEVKITEEVRKLQALQEEISKLPEVDEQRVEKIKSAIANGDYQTNARSIAHKILGEQNDV